MARIAILGGGISGLVCAYRLAQAGATPVIFEASEQLGGLGGAFDLCGTAIDRFYHIMLDTDDALIALIGELGGAGRLHWAATGMGVYAGGAVHPLNGPVDLLRFPPLTFPQRLRTAAGALYLTRFVRDGQPLDGVSAARHLRSLFGPQVYRYMWEPLLRAKFGEFGEDVPAYWLWSRLNREKKSGPERKGYPEGGYAWIAQALAERVEGAGGEIHCNRAVTKIEDGGVNGETFDAVVSTLPLPVFERLSARSVPRLRYQGVVNVLLALRHRLQPYYWTALIDANLGFQGVVETTHVLPLAWTGGRHLVYLMNYCAADSAVYRQPDDILMGQAHRALRQVFPETFPANSVEGAFVFRTPHVEPVWPLNYLEQRPAARAGERLFLCTTAQLYPAVNAWNSCVAQANAVAAEVAKVVIR